MTIALLIDPAPPPHGRGAGGDVAVALRLHPQRHQKGCGELKELFDKRTPPPGTSPRRCWKRQFWTGRKIFVFADDVTSWNSAQNPLMELADYVETADQLGMHIIAAADIKLWSFQASGNSMLGRLAGALQPTIILDGRREHGPIISGVYAEPQRRGRASMRTPAAPPMVCWWPDTEQTCTNNSLRHLLDGPELMQSLMTQAGDWALWPEHRNRDFEPIWPFIEVIGGDACRVNLAQVAPTLGLN